MRITKKKHSFDTQYFGHKVRVRSMTLYNQNQIGGDKSTTSLVRLDAKLGTTHI